MKAVLVRRYGPPESIVLADLPDPVPGPRDILVRIHAATVSSADMRMRAGRFPRGMGLLARLAIGFTGPRKPVLGTDLAGQVVAVGALVTAWVPGDAVVAFMGAGLGGHAQLRVLGPGVAICRKPASLDWAEAAAISFGGATALYFLRDRAAVKAGERVLVVGASGAVGSAAVQLAVGWGAVVTGVCSAAKAGFVAGMGAEVIDYGRSDWARAGRQWDVIVDTTGTVDAGRARASLVPGGRLCLVAADLPQMLGGVFARGMRVQTGVAPERSGDLATLAALAEAGRFSPHVGARFALDQAAAAHALVDTGRKTGNVVLEMG